MFPFTSGYGVYAGNCASADPVSYNPSYWTQGSGFTTPSPGGSSSVTVREPAVNLLVTRSGSPLGGAHVIARATGAGCVEARSLTTNAQGALTSPGLPFGTYTVCADDGTHFFSKPGVVNTNPAGTAAVPLAIPASGIPGRGVCT